MIKKKSVTLQNLYKDYGDGSVIENLSAHIEAKSFTVILGPSGCGKSTLMNMIAGLESVTGGKILIGNDEVQEKAPKEREIAMVFQNYALYPHMSVADNIGYAMKVAGVKKAERLRRIRKVAEVVELSHCLGRPPAQLSGGQQQRVAIARAIVRKPKVILYDEPLSNLDAKLRHEMRIEIMRLHKEIGATSLFVTHDQTEAMTLADKIMVLNKGKIEQYDCPDKVYNEPSSMFVAQFIGTPAMNIVSDFHPVFHTEKEKVAHANNLSKEDIVVGVRPEKITLLAESSEEGVLGETVFVENMGASVIVSILIGKITLKMIIFNGSMPEIGQKVRIQMKQQDLHYFCQSTGQRLEKKEET